LSPIIAPTVIGRCFATSLPPLSSATNAKKRPLMRSTLVTGSTSPSLVFQMMRARTYCDARSWLRGFWTRPFTSSACV